MIEKLSELEKEEEILFKAGQKFKVTNIYEESKTKRTIIEMEQI